MIIVVTICCTVQTSLGSEKVRLQSCNLYYSTIICDEIYVQISAQYITNHFALFVKRIGKNIFYRTCCLFGDWFSNCWTSRI